MGSNLVKDFIEVGSVRVEYERTSISLDLYEKIISWGRYGLNRMVSLCRKDPECGERYKLIEQGMGILGNALVSYAFIRRGYPVVPDPVIVRESERCVMKEGSRYDVAVSVENRFLLVIEVKLYRRTSENIPSFPNIDEVYGENPRPRRLLEECSAIPVGILLEMSKPSNARIPYYIVEVDRVNGRKAHDAIYASIAEWCRARRIPLATT